MRRSQRVIAASLGLLLTAACGVTDLERDTEAPVQTSELEYTLQETMNGDALSARIPYRYTNPTDAPLCMSHCQGAFFIGLDRKAGDGSWRRAWSPVIPACLSESPIQIAPGGTYRDTLRVFHALRDDLHPKIDADPILGIYRINIMAASRPTGEGQCGTDEVPVDLRVSNPFELNR